MYKLLLSWRYLRTRWIALASIISVTLGVAVMIVVNSVMEGFRHEMQGRIHGILSDVIFESNNVTGFYDPDRHMEQINEVAGDYIEGMTPTVVVPAMVSFEYNGSSIMRPVQLIGIDARSQSRVGDFCKYLQHPANREQISFELRAGGYDTIDHQAGPGALERPDMIDAGWEHRRKWVERQRFLESMKPRPTGPRPIHRTRLSLARRWLRHHPLGEPDAAPLIPGAEAANAASAGHEETIGIEAPVAPAAAADQQPTGVEPAGLDQVIDEANPLRGQENYDGQATSPTEAHSVANGAGEPRVENAMISETPGRAPPDVAAPEAPAPIDNPFAKHDAPPTDVFDPARQQHAGVVMGIALADYRDAAGRERFLVRPGDDVRLSFPNAGSPPDIEHASFTVVDLYESKMSEYDASFVFVPIDVVQQYRGMFDPQTKIGYATSIQIKLKPGVDGNHVRDLLRGAFVPQLYSISTWRDKQGPLLAAVQMETAILNVLLFLIIAVAGFGILAIFYMIVVEKTRDIGILKTLGISRRGIQGIFLGYGLSLGLVGSGAGMIIGLLFVKYLNEIADVLGMITGQEVFDPSIYYFQQIPTIVEPVTVAWIVLGSLLIAVVASVLPARRASRLHPVEALRYE